MLILLTTGMIVFNLLYMAVFSVSMPLYRYARLRYLKRQALKKHRKAIKERQKQWLANRYEELA